MVWVRPTDRMARVAESLSGAESALEEVFHYNKFGRHGKAFPEKPYLLLSYCTHVLFSLRLVEEEMGGIFSRRAPHPAAFLVGLDFGVLRASDYKRRMLHADSLEDHWKNETKWFEFWMRILERIDPSGTAIYQEFSRRVLTCVAHGSFLEGKAVNRDRKGLARFMKTDEAGRVMLHTMSVLKDLVWVMVCYFAASDPRTCVLEQISLVAGLLHEIRRIIVCETPAMGPYAPRGAARWRVPPPWTRLCCGRTQGILTVVPRREGGGIICTYSPASDSKGRKRSWVHRVSSLTGTYEEELFATWSYDNGEYLEDPPRFPDARAHWTVQNAEAARLETISRQVDILLEVLRRNPLCESIVEAVRRLLRNKGSRWKATELPWTYIKELDQLLNMLTLVCREAKVVSGNDAAERVTRQIRPLREATTDVPGSCRLQNCQGETAPGVSTSKDEISSPVDLRSTPSKLDSCTSDKPQQASGSPDQLIQTESPRESSLTVPDESMMRESQQKPELHPFARRMEVAEQEDESGYSETGSPTPHQKPRQQSDGQAKAISTSLLGRADNPLLLRLLEHHGCLGGTIRYRPISSAELQRALGWNRSKVQRAMSDIFGTKPLRVYNEKCKDRIITEFLKEFVNQKREVPSHGVRALCVSTR